MAVPRGTGAWVWLATNPASAATSLTQPRVFRPPMRQALPQMPPPPTRRQTAPLAPTAAWMRSRMGGLQATALLTSQPMVWFSHLTAARMWLMVDKMSALAGPEAVVMPGCQKPQAVGPIFPSVARKAERLAARAAVATPGCQPRLTGSSMFPSAARAAPIVVHRMLWIPLERMPPEQVTLERPAPSWSAVQPARRCFAIRSINRFW